MNKQEFTAHYIATFLAAYAASNYDMNCLADKAPADYVQPVDVAASLANEAWTKLQLFMTK